MTIYITEAHAHDEWPIGEQYKAGFPQLNQPKSLQERFSAAAALKTDFDCKCVRERVCVCVRESERVRE